MSTEIANQALTQLSRAVGSTLVGVNALRISDKGGSLPSRFHVGAIASASIAAQAQASAAIWHHRTGHSQDIEVDMRQALAMFRSEHYLLRNGEPVRDGLCPLFGFYTVADGRWVQLHTNFPHHREGVLRLLQCEPTRDAVAQALKHWKAEELEAALAEAGLVGSAIRTPAQWLEHPQAQAISQLPILEVVKIGEAPPVSLKERGDGSRPLSGVRVLDLSRVIAAPVGARALAQHGADVLAINAPHLPNITPFLIDTSRGKRSAQLDLRQAGDAEKLLSLACQADVFIQAYRPGALSAKGFSVESLVRARPGLIYVTLSAYSHAGPWSTRRGYDSLVQSATGIAHAEAELAGMSGPGKLPCQALDHATGYLAAFGAMVALHRRALEGGSWMVRVSLAQTAQWMRALGDRGSSGLMERDIQPSELTSWMEEIDSPYGSLKAVSPVERMSLTEPRLILPPVPPGTHSAAW